MHAEGGYAVVEDARAFWLLEPGRGQIRSVPVPDPGPDDVLVRTLWSGISRGTESLVFRGHVPEREYQTMAAPFQDGQLPGPVKYGYLNVGTVESGPPELVDRPVFCLYPHQTHYVVPASAVVPVPSGVPAARAVLAGTMETAVNALWDARPLIGDRVAVVGAGMVGCCVARLAGQIPGVQVTLVDTNPDRAHVAASFGMDFEHPDDAPGRNDFVFHASATSAGLTRSLELLGTEGTVIELSWYGDTPVTVPLGESFHSSRLTIRSSQVGMVAESRRGRRTHRDRLSVALDLLVDPAYDVLLTGSSAFDDLPETMAAIAGGSLEGLCHTISYDDAHGREA